MRPTAFPPLCPPETPRCFGAPTLHTDGELLALGITSEGVLWSIEEPNELRSRDLATRRQLSSRPLEGAATLWAFNWAGRLLASASDEVTVYECASGTELASWGAGPWVTALAFQPGAAVLATGHDDGSVRVWDWTEQRLLHELRGHTRAVSAVAFSRDGGRLATAGEERAICVWDLATGKQTATMEGHTDRVPALAWHPDGTRLTSAGWDTTVRVWDARTGEPIILLNSHATQVHALAISGDGALLASADSSNAVRIWDLHGSRELAVLRDQTAEVRCLAFTPDDGRGNLTWPLLTYGGADRVIYLWDSRQAPGGAGSADALVNRSAVAVSGDGRRLYSVGLATPVRCWDVETGQPQPAPADAAPRRAFALSPDGCWLAASRSGPTVNEEDRATLELYDAATGVRQAVCDGQRAPVTALAFSADSTLLASGGARSSDVWLWQMPTGQPALLIADVVDDCSVEALALQPDGRLLAVAGIDWMATSGGDGQVVLWDLDRRKAALTLPGGATAVAFSPKGQLLAVATLGRSVRVHDVSDGRLVFDLRGHLETVLALAYSPDGNWLASAGEDRSVRLWDARTGAAAAAWELDNPVRALAFSPDGKSLYTGNANTSCYQIDVAQLLATGL